MNHSVTVWCIIAAVLLCAFLFRAVERHFVENAARRGNARHILEIGRERDMFYIPGDVSEDDEEG